MFGKLGNFGKNAAKVLNGDQPVYRFGGGFMTMGAQVRPADTRTTGEVIATMEALAERNPDIKQFLAEIKKMPLEHMKLASDTMELARMSEMLSGPQIVMNRKHPQSGKTLLQSILEVLPKASKENPAALDFAQEVINNTDTTTSKYFLAAIKDAFLKTELAEHLKAAKPMVKPIAEQTLAGGYTMDFSKQESFVNFIATLVNKNANPDKIAFLPKLSRAVDDMPGVHPLYIGDFVKSNTPLKQVEENLETVKDVAKLVHENGKSINIVDFVTKNINLD